MVPETALTIHKKKFLDCKKNNVIFSEILSSEIPNLEDLQSSEDLEIGDLQSSELSEPFDLQSSEEDFTPTLVLKEQYTKVFLPIFLFNLFNNFLTYFFENFVV